MLEFLLENWASEHIGLQLTLDDHLTVFHQAMTQAVFVQESEHEENRSETNDPSHKYCKMLRLLVTHGEHLGMPSIESKDRLGRTVLHLAAMHGCTELVRELIKPESEGGLGAVLFALDLEGDMPIHLAIDFHR